MASGICFPSERGGDMLEIKVPAWSDVYRMCDIWSVVDVYIHYWSDIRRAQRIRSDDSGNLPLKLYSDTDGVSVVIYSFVDLISPAHHNSKYEKSDGS